MFASRCGETASLGSSKSSGTIEVERSMEEPPFDEDLWRVYLFSKGTLPSLFDLEKIFFFIQNIKMFWKFKKNTLQTRVGQTFDHEPPRLRTWSVFFWLRDVRMNLEIGPIFLRRFRLYVLYFMFRFMFANICFVKNQNSKIHVMFIISITWNETWNNQLLPFESLVC